MKNLLFSTCVLSPLMVLNNILVNSYNLVRVCLKVGRKNKEKDLRKRKGKERTPPCLNVKTQFG